jgi:hypothetical protein
MGFLDEVGNFLGDALGWNQAQAAQQQKEQSQEMMNQAKTGLATATNQAQAQNEYSTGQEKAYDAAAKESMGTSAADMAGKAEKSAEGLAGKEAAGAGQAATETALGGARTAGMNKGEAALTAGNAAEKAATGTYGSQINQGIQNYNQDTQQIANAGNAQAGNAIASTGQQVQAGQATGQLANQQAQQAQAGMAAPGQAIGGAVGSALKAAGMQEGGTFEVPEGHPKDTFPVMVSSGEKVTVIPEGETLQSIMKKINAKKAGEPGPIGQKDIEANEMKKLILHLCNGGSFKVGTK